MYQNPNPQPEDASQQRTKSKRIRPFEIEYRFSMYSASNNPRWTDWRTWKRYRTEQERDDALENLNRKAPSCWEHRAKPNE